MGHDLFRAEMQLALLKRCLSRIQKQTA